MNQKGFTLKSFLFVIGIILIASLVVFFIQRREKENPQVAIASNFYQHYIANQNLDGFNIFTEEMKGYIENQGAVSVLCLPWSEEMKLDNVKVKEGSNSEVEVWINKLDRPIEVVFYGEGEALKIVDIRCPLQGEIEAVPVEETEETAPVTEEEAAPVVEEEIAPVSRARKDLASRLAIDIADISLVSTEEVLFSDATLGVSAPGEAHNQIITPGYIIFLSVGERVFLYHADNQIVIFMREE